MRTMFTPLKIAGMEVKNRTFMAPMSLGYESQDGTVNEKMEAYWLRRAQGGVGCIIVDATSVDPNVPYLGNTLCFRDEESIKKYKSFTDKVHSYGCKIIPQITHPGPESISAFFGVAPVASSSYPNSMGQMTRELAKEELPGIVALYAKASKNAKEAGFDGIELHCAHAYMLLGSFLSPLRNKRTDEYGGSLLNRARLLFEVLDAIKETCGEDFPIVLRMSGSERDPQGNTLEDMKRLIPYLEKHGVDCFEISGGTQYERCNKIIPCHGEEEFTNLKEARAIKEITTKPVITVGKILDAQLAEDVLEANDVLSGKVSILGGNAAIIGGGMVGIETAEYVLHHSRGAARAALIEMTDSIGQGMVPNNLVPTMARLRQENVQMITGARVKKIDAGTIIADTKKGEMKYPGFTHVICAVGSKAWNPLYEEIKDTYETYVIGDAKEVAQALEAVRGAYELGYRL